MASDAFEGATAISSITCNATTPPAGCVFEDVVYERISESENINVPEEALEAYKADPNWGRFWPPKSPITFETMLDHGMVVVLVNDAAIESGDEVAEGKTVKVVLSPDEGYELGSFSVETVEAEQPSGLRRASVPTTQEDEDTYSFKMPGEPIAINVTFQESTVTAINDLRAAGYEGEVYVDVMGRVSTHPFKGINIVVKTDGTVTKTVK